MSPIILFAIPAFGLLILAEWWRATKLQRDIYEIRDTAANLSMGVGNVLIASFVKAGTVALYFVIYEFRIFDLPTGFSAATLWVWPLLILAEDFCYYWFHRIHHESRLFWAAHVNHHSSQRYNYAVALRQSWTTPITGMPFWLILPLIGFHPLMIVTAQAISLIYQFWIHTQLINRLGPLEWVFNTPSHHRVHHGANPQYIDKNYGGILIIWDRLFGSFEPEHEPVRYGLTKNIKSHNPLHIAFHAWQGMFRDIALPNTWKNRLGLIFKRPGWRPANEHLRPNQNSE